LGKFNNYENHYGNNSNGEGLILSAAKLSSLLISGGQYNDHWKQRKLAEKFSVISSPKPIPSQFLWFFFVFIIVKVFLEVNSTPEQLARNIFSYILMYKYKYIKY
jgi:hypothetical protein